MGAFLHTGRLFSRWATGRPADWWADAVLYRRLIGARIRAQMQYRVSFLLMTLIRLIVTGSELLAILILFNYFGELAGWLPVLTPLAAAMLALMAWLAWQAGVRHYQSTGS